MKETEEGVFNIMISIDKFLIGDEFSTKNKV